MRDYEHLPAGQRKLAEQLDEEDFKREERKRELKEARDDLLDCLMVTDEIEKCSGYFPPHELERLENNLENAEEHILEVLKKYN